MSVQPSSHSIREVAERLRQSLEAPQLPDRDTETGIRRLLDEEYEVRRQLRRMREDWAPRLFWVLSGWLILTAAILVFHGFGWWGFSVEERVLMTLLGSTAVNVVGLFGIIARFVFPGPKT